MAKRKQAVDAPAKPRSRTKYKPETCEVIIALSKKGKSKAQMAAHLDISRSTFDRWLEANEIPPAHSHGHSVLKHRCLWNAVRNRASIV
jgi:DNA invertase Pin-like site-specific DNA recombinase